jgi:hypothetical protein
VPALSVAGINTTVVVGTPYSGNFVIITDPSATSAANLVATISWGNGQSWAGEVVDLGGGQFGVTGDITYADTGSYTITILVTDHESSGDQSVTAQAMVTVSPADPPPVTPSGTTDPASPTNPLPSNPVSGGGGGADQPAQRRRRPPPHPKKRPPVVHHAPVRHTSKRPTYQA